MACAGPFSLLSGEEEHFRVVFAALSAQATFWAFSSLVGQDAIVRAILVVFSSRWHLLGLPRFFLLQAVRRWLSLRAKCGFGGRLQSLGAQLKIGGPEAVGLDVRLSLIRVFPLQWFARRPWRCFWARTPLAARFLARREPGPVMYAHCGAVWYRMPLLGATPARCDSILPARSVGRSSWLAFGSQRPYGLHPPKMVQKSHHR